MNNIIVESNSSTYYKNPICNLQQLCTKHHLPLPLYNELETIGPPHSRIFIVSASVEEKLAEGTGLTKKQAKANAALNMSILLNLNDSSQMKEEPIQLVRLNASVRSTSTNSTSFTEPLDSVAEFPSFKSESIAHLAEAQAGDYSKFSNSPHESREGYIDIPRPNLFNPHIKPFSEPQLIACDPNSKLFCQPLSPKNNFASNLLTTIPKTESPLHHCAQPPSTSIKSLHSGSIATESLVNAKLNYINGIDAKNPVSVY